MGKRIFFFMGLLVLVFALSGVSYAWQGRMGGMGDPYGLVQDESDFLINPAAIAQGQGVRFYGDYRFTYTGVTAWDYDLDQFDAGGTLTNFQHFDTSGQEFKHNALLGAGLPLGPGRLGLFLTYDSMRGDYDGNEDAFFGGPVLNNFAEYDLTKNFDNFALRLLYGLPVGHGVDVGAELGLVYRNELQKTWWNETAIGGSGSQNFLWSWGVPERSLFPLMIPYDSQYWELLWKGGVKFNLLKAIIEVNLRGGTILSANNEYHYMWQSPVGTTLENGDMDGGVTGWRIGSDIWARVPAGTGWTLPLLFSFDYAAKDRDGDGIGSSVLDLGLPYNYTEKEKSLDLKVGGGIEKKLSGNALIAGGIYYNYLKFRDDISFVRGAAAYAPDSEDFPSQQEQRVVLRLAGEKEFSSTVALRMGLNFFYGWVEEDFIFNRIAAATLTDHIKLDGSHWGIGASLGGTFKIPSFHMTLEPFINGGWQQYDLDGRGDGIGGSLPPVLWEMDLSRSEWSIGGGMSILYDL
jgi:hypothetical protein